MGRVLSVRVALLAALLVGTLTGCLKVESAITINSDDTVDAVAVVAVDKSVVEQTDQSVAEIADALVNAAPLASSEPYEDDNFVGAKTTINDLPIEEFSYISAPYLPEVSITKEGGDYLFLANIDTNVGVFYGEPDNAVAELGEPTIQVTVTFPGEVIESNGQISGNSVTWQVTAQEQVELQAVGRGSGGGFPILFAVLAAGLLAVIGLVLLLVLSRRGPRDPSAGIAPTVGGPSYEAPANASFAPYPPLQQPTGSTAVTGEPYPR